MRLVNGVRWLSLRRSDKLAHTLHQNACTLRRCSGQEALVLGGLIVGVRLELPSCRIEHALIHLQEPVRLAFMTNERRPQAHVLASHVKQHLRGDVAVTCHNVG